MRESKLPLRLAIVNLTAGGMSGGFLKYLREMLPRIACRKEILETHVFSPRLIRLDSMGPQVAFHTFDGRAIRSCQKELRDSVAMVRPDVIFVPTARWFRGSKAPVVCMVRNMESLVMPSAPGLAAESLRNLGRREAARNACRRATRIIAVSEFVKRFLVSNWRVPDDRISVVYHGVGGPAQAHEVSPAPPIPAPFIFTAGTLRAYRGVEDAIRALAILRSEGKLLHVVVAGDSGGSSEAYAVKVKSLARSLGVDSAITWTSQLTPNEMSWYYSHSAAFLMTSRVEACPNTLLEAMCHGCLCISTNCDPMPEFLADAALYYPPGDVPTLVGALKVALSDAAQEHQLRSDVRRMALSFDWDRTANETIEQLILARTIATTVARGGNSGGAHARKRHHAS